MCCPSRPSSTADYTTPPPMEKDGKDSRLPLGLVGCICHIRGAQMYIPLLSCDRGRVSTDNAKRRRDGGHRSRCGRRGTRSAREWGFNVYCAAAIFILVTLSEREHAALVSGRVKLHFLGVWAAGNSTCSTSSRRRLRCYRDISSPLPPPFLLPSLRDIGRLLSSRQRRIHRPAADCSRGA